MTAELGQLVQVSPTLTDVAESAPPTTLSLPQVSPGPHLSQAVGVKGLRALQDGVSGKEGGRDTGV